jgi:hypothetical protein
VLGTLFLPPFVMPSRPVVSFQKMNFLPSKKVRLEVGEDHSVTRGFRTGCPPKFESIRITLSDLDPEQVCDRATGHFQPCIPVNSPVNRPVFASKSLTGQQGMLTALLTGLLSHLRPEGQKYVTLFQNRKCLFAAE